MERSNFASSDRVTSFSDWDEKTVRCVIERPSGPRGHAVAAVVIFEDDTWSTLVAHGASACDDDAYLDLGGCGGLRITDFLSAQDLLRAGMVNRAQFEHLKSQEDAARKSDLLKQAERLRIQAEKALADAQQMDVAAQS